MASNPSLHTFENPHDVMLARANCMIGLKYIVNCCLLDSVRQCWTAVQETNEHEYQAHLFYLALDHFLL